MLGRCFHLFLSGREWRSGDGADESELSEEEKGSRLLFQGEISEWIRGMIYVICLLCGITLIEVFVCSK